MGSRTTFPSDGTTVTQNDQPLYASGGSVTVNGTLEGSGSITAYGGPTITITNKSPDYLLIGESRSPTSRVAM